VFASIVGGTIFFRKGSPAPTPQTTQSSIPSTIATTTIPTAVVASSSIVPSTTVGPSKSDIDRIAATVKALLSQGNVVAAARMAAEGVNRAPGNTALGAVVQDVIAAAVSTAIVARRQADQVNGPDRPRYSQALEHVQAAIKLKESGRLEQAVNEYLTAARLFDEAAKESEPSTTTTIDQK